MLGQRLVGACAIALIAAFILGCSRTPALYERDLTSGPTANVEGLWISESTQRSWEITKTGDGLKVEETSLSPGGLGGGYHPERKVFPLLGAPKGRVCEVKGWDGPEVLITGHSEGVGEWREVVRIERPYYVRKEPIVRCSLSEVDSKMYPRISAEFPGTTILDVEHDLAELRDSLVVCQYGKHTEKPYYELLLIPLQDKKQFHSFLLDYTGTFRNDDFPPWAAGKMFTHRADWWVTGSVLPWVKTREMLTAVRSGWRLFESTRGKVDGKPCWWIMAPKWKAGDPANSPSQVNAELYLKDPKTNALPKDVLIIAERDASGKWKVSPPQYVMSAMTPLAVTCALEKGIPSHVVAQSVKSPPLEEFLSYRQQVPAMHRWQNNMLLAAKNETVPGMAREWKTSQLRESAGSIEREALTLFEKVDQANQAAQDVVARGMGAPGPLREIAVILKARIEILKAINRAVKKEVSNRAK